MQKDENTNAIVYAGLALTGMLSHATRYHQREEDAGLHWHEAIAREAFDIGQEMAREAKSRGLDK